MSKVAQLIIESYSWHTPVSYTHLVAITMYELGIMAYDVAVIRCIVVALKRNVSSSWLIKKMCIRDSHQCAQRLLVKDD